jgi:hypothetical protein
MFSPRCIIRAKGTKRTIPNHQHHQPQQLLHKTSSFNVIAYVVSVSQEKWPLKAFGNTDIQKQIKPPETISDGFICLRVISLLFI